MGITITSQVFMGVKWMMWIDVPSIFMEAPIEIIFHGGPTCCSQEPGKGHNLLA